MTRDAQRGLGVCVWGEGGRGGNARYVYIHVGNMTVTHDPLWKTSTAEQGGRVPKKNTDLEISLLCEFRN